jgi:hypothetical protein
MIDNIKNALSSIAGTWSEKNGIYEFSAVIAERKAFLSKKKLTYVARFRIDEEKKEVRFTEYLKESGMGLSGGSDMDMSPGFGFKTSTYKTGFGQPREENINEQSDLFGKEYTYTFEWGVVRKSIEEIAIKNGYAYSYHVTSLGL